MVLSDLRQIAPFADSIASRARTRDERDDGMSLMEELPLPEELE
jgi:hypothetical protein